jgi:hypothetical protein
MLTICREMGLPDKHSKWEISGKMREISSVADNIERCHTGYGKGCMGQKPAGGNNLDFISSFSELVFLLYPNIEIDFG